MSKIELCVGDCVVRKDDPHRREMRITEIDGTQMATCERWNGGDLESQYHHLKDLRKVRPKPQLALSYESRAQTRARKRGGSSTDWGAR